MKLRNVITFIFAIIASHINYAAADDFYAKTTIGLSAFKSDKGKNPNPEILTGASKLNGDTSANLNLAGGYYINDIFRAEVGINFYSTPKLNSQFHSKDYGSSAKISRKPEIMGLMAGGYANLFDIKQAKFFFGGKCGISRIKEAAALERTMLNNSGQNISQGSFKYKGKQINNFAYGVALGTAIPIYDTIKTDIEINYNDFGKSKSLKKDGTEYGKTSYKSIGVEAGIRVDF